MIFMTYLQIADYQHVCHSEHSEESYKTGR
jgi:hypothetical protein